MKTFLIMALVPVIALTAWSQEKEPFVIKAAFVPKKGRGFVGAVVATNATQIEYRATLAAQTTTVSAIRDFETIFFMEPAEYAAAMDLYEAGKFEDAKAQFADYKNKSKVVLNLPGNYHVLSAYYELECLRNMGEYKALTEALADFPKAQLTREHQLRQLELYVLWDAVRAGNWERVFLLAQERETQKMPDYQIVQVQYCKGLALQNLNRPAEAMLAYNAVMTADAATSELLVSKAALNLLEIYSKDEGVKTAIADWGTELEKKGSVGYNMLLEAGNLARLYANFFNSIKEMPVEYKKLMDYKDVEAEEAAE